MNIAAKKILIF